VADDAIVVGSGPGGSVAAWILAAAGWNVTVFEKGPDYFGDLTTPSPSTQFSNDELKELRFFDQPDWEQAEPRTYYRQSDDQSGAPRVTGFVNQLPTNVGGGTVHWDAKTPRYWDIDFKKRSTPGLGPVPGADVQDWPVAYADLAPYYDAVEQLIGVQGDLSALQSMPTYPHHPQSAFAMPPGPGEYGSLKASAGARTLGLHPFPTPMAINSQQHDGRLACNNCGFCSGFGCPIHARVGALAPLRRALQTGRVQLRADTFVSRVNWTNRRATNVTVVGPDGRESTHGGGLVVLAASAIETARLALLSGLPGRNGLMGRNLMFHWFTDAFGVFFGERIHANRGRSTTHDVEDFADPDYPGARAAAAANGLPYMRGGILEMGGTQDLIAEGLIYQGLLQELAPEKPFGASFKQLMRASPLRDRLLGIQMIAEDLAQPDNRITLDPKVTDVYGRPVARITYSPHRHEQAAQRFYMPQLVAILKAAGADLAAAVPGTSTADFPVAQGDAPSGAHIMGGMRTGSDPAISVCDPDGRIHDLDNVFVSDAGLFVTSGAVNPTLTLMTVALRNAVAFSGLGHIPPVT
jgi:gluconate 2-dehydrogenase alpha chain